MKNEFGRFLREMRQQGRVSLRAFSTEIEMDPSNYSKIERGILLPPEGELLQKIGDELGLRRNTPEWQQFIYLADTSRGQLPADIAEDEEIAAALPAFFQRLREERLTDPATMYSAFVSVVRER